MLNRSSGAGGRHSSSRILHLLQEYVQRHRSVRLSAPCFRRTINRSQYGYALMDSPFLRIMVACSVLKLHRPIATPENAIFSAVLDTYQAASRLRRQIEYHIASGIRSSLYLRILVVARRAWFLVPIRIFATHSFARLASKGIDRSR